MHTRFLVTMRACVDKAIEAERNKQPFELHLVLQEMERAVSAAEFQSAGPRCEAPKCGNGLNYSGMGRYPRFCSDKCKQAAYRAQRRRQATA